MRYVVVILGLALLTVPLSSMASAQEGETCAFLIDFGDGRTYWVDVPLQEGMNGFDVFINATTMIGLTETHNYLPPWGHQVMSIDGYSGNYNFSDPNAPYDFWRLLRWSDYDNGWIWTSVLLDGVDPYATEAIAFIYTRWTYMGPPLSTPFHRDTWISERNDYSNTGSALHYAPSSVELQWSKDLGNGAIDASVTYAGGRTYVITSGITDMDGGYQTDASLFCLDEVGNVVWTADMGEGHHVAAPMLWNGAIYAPSADGRLFAFDLATGALRWAYDTGWSPQGITSSPLMHQNLIIVANSNGRVVALEQDGELQWELTLPTTVTYTSAVRNGLLLVGGGDGSLYALAGDGSGVEWTVPVGSAISGSPVAFKNHIVVTYSNLSGDQISGGVAAVSYEGDLLWSIPTGPGAGSAAMTSTGVVAPSSLGLSMVGSDGSLRWTADMGTTTFVGSPVTVKGMSYLVVTDDTSRLVAVDDNGTVAWNEDLGSSAFVGSPSIANGTLFLPSSDGKVYAYSFTDLQPYVPPGPDDGVPDDDVPPNDDDGPDDDGQTTVQGSMDPYVMGGAVALAVIVVATAYVYWYKRTNK